MSFLLNFRLKHPVRGTNSIDFNVAMLMVPGLLYGTLFGIALNIVIPSFLILMAMTVMLSFCSYKTFSKYYYITFRVREEYQNESEQQLIKTNISSVEMENYTDRAKPPDERIIKNELAKESVYLPKDKMIPLLITYLFFLLISFLIGNPKSPSIIGIKK
jgi:hypothetical protein